MKTQSVCVCVRLVYPVQGELGSESCMLEVFFGLSVTESSFR